jgi:hypothetical protein
MPVINIDAAIPLSDCMILVCFNTPYCYISDSQIGPILATSFYPDIQAYDELLIAQMIW